MTSALPSESFAASDTLVALVADPVLARGSLEPAEHDAFREDVRHHLRHIVLGLLNTMAGSLQYADKLAPYPFCVDATFPEPIAKAFLFRVVVEPARQAAFLAQLAQEVQSAAQAGLLRGPFWELQAQEAAGTPLHLVVTQPRPAPVASTRERAKPVMFKFGQRAARSGSSR